MNNRVRELLDQVGLETDGTRPNSIVTALNEDGHMIGHMFYHNFERFADLLVQDAIAVINRRYMGDQNREDQEVLRCIEDLRVHFGVKDRENQ